MKDGSKEIADSVKDGSEKIAGSGDSGNTVASEVLNEAEFRNFNEKRMLARRRVQGYLTKKEGGTYSQSLEGTSRDQEYFGTYLAYHAVDPETGELKYYIDKDDNTKKPIYEAEVYSKHGNGVKMRFTAVDSKTGNMNGVVEDGGALLIGKVRDVEDSLSDTYPSFIGHIYVDSEDGMAKNVVPVSVKHTYLKGNPENSANRSGVVGKGGGTISRMNNLFRGKGKNEKDTKTEVTSNYENISKWCKDETYWQGVINVHGANTTSGRHATKMRDNLQQNIKTKSGKNDWRAACLQQL